MSDRNLHSNGDRGFTMVEMLIAILVTAVISVVIMRMFTTASLALNRAADESAAAVQATRFSRLIKYDVSGSDDAFIFGTNYPTGTSATGYLNNLCSSTKGTTTATAKWTADPAGTSDFVRTLFTLRIPTIGYDPASSTTTTFAKDDGTVTGLHSRWVSYEVRSGETSKGRQFELWRVECDPQWSADVPPIATPKSSIAAEERIVILGNALASSTSGQSVLQCFNRAGGQVEPAVGYTTTDPDRLKGVNVCTAYRFLLPYNGSRNALNRIAGSEKLGDSVDVWLQRMSTMVERLD